MELTYYRIITHLSSFLFLLSPRKFQNKIWECRLELCHKPSHDQYYSFEGPSNCGGEEIARSGLKNRRDARPRHYGARKRFQWRQRDQIITNREVKNEKELRRQTRRLDECWGGGVEMTREPTPKAAEQPRISVCKRKRSRRPLWQVRKNRSTLFQSSETIASRFYHSLEMRLHSGSTSDALRPDMEGCANGGRPSPLHEPSPVGGGLSPLLLASQPPKRPSRHP